MSTSRSRADEVREREKEWGPWIPVKESAIDTEKFKAHYGLQDADFQTAELNGQAMVRVKKTVDLGRDPIVVEAPPVPLFKSPADYAGEIAALLLKTPEDQEVLTDKLLRLIGNRPMEPKE